MIYKLSVVVPCYNEETRFKEGFSHYYSFLKKQKYPWELILVNDGSLDKTLKLMKKVAKSHPNIKVISYHKNLGKGYAITCGAKSAKGQYILFSDIDHSVGIDTIKSFLKYFENGFDVVIGSRRVPGAKITKRQHFFRELLGRGFTFLVRILIDWRVHDATCGFKAFSSRQAQKIFKKITIYNWAFDAEVLFLIKKYKIKYFQAPVIWRDAKGTKVSLKKDIVSSLFGLLRIHLNDLMGRYR